MATLGGAPPQRRRTPAPRVSSEVEVMHPSTAQQLARQHSQELMASANHYHRRAQAVQQLHLVRAGGDDPPHKLAGRLRRWLPTVLLQRSRLGRTAQ